MAERLRRKSEVFMGAGPGFRWVCGVALALAVASLWRLNATAQAPGPQDPVVTVPSTTYPDDEKAFLGNAPAPALKGAYTRGSIPNSAALPSLAAAVQQDASGPQGRLQVGVNRAVPPGALRPLAGGALGWTPVAGGSVTAVSLTSPGAVGLRLAIAFERLPDGAEVRFFGVGPDGQVMGPFSSSQLRALMVPGESGEPDVFWSPDVSGETAAMEVFVPAGEENDVAFTIPRVSHRYLSLAAPEKAAESCSIDVACYSTDWGTTARAVARYTFVSGGGTYLCTGTLLNDTDPSGFIPYFLTANHCVGTQSEASTINTWWMYQRTSCLGSLGSFTQLYGGATLLSTGTSSDHTLVRLNEPAPASAVFAGWSSAVVTNGTSMVGIHHPEGDVKKISFGVIDGISSYGGSVTGTGGYLRVHWTAGVTLGGSSGSALITGTYPNDRVRGTLKGGASSCTVTSGADWYGRFDLVYPLISAYLSPAPATRVLTLTGNLAFGPVPTQTTSSRTLTIGNTGNSPMTVSAIYYPAGFSGNFPSGTIAAGGSQAVTVTFAPTAGGAYGGVITVFANNTSGTTQIAVSGTGVAVRTTGTADFDGDGKGELAIYRPSTGEWYVRQTSDGYYGALFRAYQWGLGGDVPVVGDFDGDRKTDVTVYRPSSGEWQIRYSSQNYVPGAGPWWFQWGLGADRPIVGDFDGDRRTDVTVYRPTTGEWFIRNSSQGYTPGAGSWYFQWGLPGDQPIAGDFDGDGKTDITVYRPRTGEWLIRYSSQGYVVGAGNWLLQWGLVGDVPVVGDFDGDGRVDPAVYRAPSGEWFIRYSSLDYAVGAGAWYFQWGLAGDQPMVADLDGDGKTDLTVYRPGNGEWYTRYSTSSYATGQYTVRQWGLTNDTPLPTPIAGNMTGRWAGTVRIALQGFSPSSYDLTLTLTQNGTTLSGTCSGPTVGSTTITPRQVIIQPTGEIDSFGGCGGGSVDLRYYPADDWLSVIYKGDYAGKFTRQ